jgi:hypothetical protein
VLISCIAPTPERGVKPFPTSGGLVTITKRCRLAAASGCRSFGIEPEILEPSRREAAPVAELRNDDHSILIEKYRRSQPVHTAISFPRTRVGHLGLFER